MRSWIVWIGVVAALIIVGLFVWPGHLLSGHGRSSAEVKPAVHVSNSATTRYGPGTAVPASALAACQHLVSSGITVQRSALSPELAAQVPSSGSVFPAGTTLAMDPSSWHASAGFANAFGVLTEPDHPAQQIQIGFSEQESGTWLIDFEEVLS
jgi:hypothetical protein